jgi:CubicO group peptidase (beta-lactamase class C family)
MIEEVSGLGFESFLHRNIWEPLGMRRSSVDVPASLQADVAMGYELRNDSLLPQPWEWCQTTPASSINAAVADMGRFLIAHLPPAGSGRRASLVTAHYERCTGSRSPCIHPSIPGYALGFNEDYIGDVRVLEHGDTMAGFSALIRARPE